MKWLSTMKMGLDYFYGSGLPNHKKTSWSQPACSDNYLVVFSTSRLKASVPWRLTKNRNGKKRSCSQPVPG